MEIEHEEKISVQKVSHITVAMHDDENTCITFEVVSEFDLEFEDEPYFKIIPLMDSDHNTWDSIEKAMQEEIKNFIRNNHKK